MPTRGYDRRSFLTYRRWLRRAVGIVALAVGLVAGCKSGSGGRSVGGNLTSRNTDPLMGGSRIPPQDLPIPGRETYGARDRKDPLLDPGRPAVRGNNTERTQNPTPTKKNDAAARPATTRVPYRPDRSSTTAALTGRLGVDDSVLSIGDRPGSRDGSFGGPVPLRRVDESALTGGLSYDQIAEKLRDDFGATLQTPERGADGQYVFRCDIPQPGDEIGRMRHYQDMGPTPAAAAKKVLDRVQGDYAGR